MLAAGRRGDAVKLFMTTVGMPAEAVARMQNQPAWPLFEAIAPTLAYDDAILGDGTVPRERAANVTVPTLVVDGEASPQELRRTTKATASALPTPSTDHWKARPTTSPPEALAPVLKRFFA